MDDEKTVEVEAVDDGLKAGRRHNANDMQLLKRIKAGAQDIGEAAVALGADDLDEAVSQVEQMVNEVIAEDQIGKAVSLTERAQRVEQAFSVAYPEPPYSDSPLWREAMRAHPRSYAVYDDYLIVRTGTDYYRVDYSVGAEGVTLQPREQWRKVEQDWTATRSVDTLVAFGEPIKTFEGGRVGGYLVRFGSDQDRDLTGEWFTAKTYYGPRDGDGVDTLVHHGMPLGDGLEELADHWLAPLKTRRTDVGIWAETVLNLADEYEKTVYEMAKQGKLGWSSGAPRHMVKRKKSGEIARWPIAEGSLTPMPAEPRNRVVPLKALTEEYAPAGVQIDLAGQEHVEEVNAMGDEVKTVGEQTGAPSGTMAAPLDSAALAALIATSVAEAVKGVEASFTDKMTALMKTLEGEPPLKTGGYAVPNVQVKRDEMTETKAFDLFLRYGNEAPPEALKFVRRRSGKIVGVDMTEAKATLAEGTDAQGGYWVPTVHANEIEVPLTNASYLRRAGATVMTDMQGTDSFKIPSLTFTTAAVIGTEGSVYTPAEPTAGEIEFNPYKLKRLAKATEEMVEDSRYNVWSMILQPDFEQSFVEGENNYFTTGTGSGQPQGVLYGATTGVTTASPTAIAADELIDLFYSVDYKYREDSTFAWMMNDSTLKVIRKLKDGDGNYLWAAGLGGQPDTILSKRVITNNAFPAIATGQSTILVGAFRYYRIASWPGLQIQRLVEKYADTGHIGFRAYRRIDANIMQAAAFRKLVQA